MSMSAQTLYWVCQMDACGGLLRGCSETFSKMEVSANGSCPDTFARTSTRTLSHMCSADISSGSEYVQAKAEKPRNLSP